MSDSNIPTPPPTPAGWYPDGTPGQERFYDGLTWTAEVRPLPAPGPLRTENPQPVLSPAKEPWFRRKRFLIPLSIVGGFIILGSVLNAVTGNGDGREITGAIPSKSGGFVRGEDTKQTPVPVDTRVEIPDLTGKTVAEAVTLLGAIGVTLELPAEMGQDWIIAEQSVPGGSKIEPGDPFSISAAAPKPVYTVAQENAIEEALSYLNYSDFSRAGLFDQLTSEYGAGFEAADAEFAIATLEQTGQVDWNAEAVEAAQSYMDYSSFSRDGLYDQLTSQYGGQFTPEQANAGLAAVGY